MRQLQVRYALKVDTTPPQAPLPFLSTDKQGQADSGVFIPSSTKTPEGLLQGGGILHHFPYFRLCCCVTATNVEQTTGTLKSDTPADIARL